MAILSATVAVLWIAHGLGWLEGVPWAGLAGVTGFWLLVGLARFYAIRKGFALDQDFRPDDWEKAGQTLIVACLAASFAGLLVAI